jgi:hypothetical protein
MKFRKGTLSIQQPDGTWKTAGDVLNFEFIPRKSPPDMRGREEACLPGLGGLCTACGTGDCLRRPE